MRGEPWGGEIEDDDVVGAGLAGDPVELLLDVAGGGLGVGEGVDVGLGEAADGGVGEDGGEGEGVGGGVVQGGDAAVGEAADADHQRPLLLDGTCSLRRVRWGCGGLGGGCQTAG